MDDLQIDISKAVPVTPTSNVLYMETYTALVLVINPRRARCAPSPTPEASRRCPAASSSMFTLEKRHD
jgi:hypothetical protein